MFNLCCFCATADILPGGPVSCLARRQHVYSSADIAQENPERSKAALQTASDRDTPLA